MSVEAFTASVVSSPVGEQVVQAISRVRTESGELATGNVLRRLCQWAGEGACQENCQLSCPDNDLSLRESEARLRKKECADANTYDVISHLGLDHNEVLIVGVTGDKIGFADKLSSYSVNHNVLGWRELSGFNAFFAREDELKSIGRRLADCADLNFEFKDSEGQTVFGFEHGTRTNMFGSEVYKFEKDGKKMSYTESVLQEAIEHYGADPNSVRITLAAAIKGENFKFTFKDESKLQEVLPGWFEDGFAINTDNADWQPGQPFQKNDTWSADTNLMIIRDVHHAMHAIGVASKNFTFKNAIDPSQSGGIHSSFLRARTDEQEDTRDLYMTYLK